MRYYWSLLLIIIIYKKCIKIINYIYIDTIEACVNDVEVPESRIDELFQLVDKDQLRPDL